MSRIEPIPLTAADTENIRAVNAMLALARQRPAHKRELFYKNAGEYLERLRRGKMTEVWAEIVRKHIGIGLARAYELVELGAGRKTLAELRAAKGASDRQWKAENLPKKRNNKIKSET
jgi:hypothetical protein